MTTRLAENDSRPLPATRRRGASLVELVFAVAIAGVLAVGLSSCLFIAVKSVPNSQDPASATLQANRIINQFATELETAIYITERSATVFGFTVPDRNGDGIAERIRYAWTGTPGGALTRQYNGGTPATVAASVDLFNLTPTFQSVAETYPGTGVEDATESLLIDNYSTSSTGNNDVTATTPFGQYYTLTLPAGTYAWRPTRVQFMAKRNSTPAVSLVQMRPATINLTPASTVLEQNTLTDTMMTGSYAWESFDFITLDPIASGGAICLVVQQQTGQKSVTLQSTNFAVGLNKTSNNGTVWSYDNGHCFVTQLFGKLTRSGGTQSLNTNYLTAMNIALRTTATAPTLQNTVAFLNHPELLSGKWELKFDQNPTTVEINGDGLNDWVVNGGGAFNMASLVNGVWQTNGTQLNTNAGCDFAKTTIVDVKFQNTSVGGNGATFTINALRNSSTCAPISAYLMKQSDGTQTLNLSTKTSDVTPKNLLSITGLPNQPVLMHLIIDPVTNSVSLTINDVQYGNFALTRFASSDSNRIAAIGANVSNAEFSYVRIRVLEQ